MAIHNRTDVWRQWHGIVKNVPHVHGVAREIDNERLGKRHSPLAGIDITSYCLYRGDILKLRQDLG